jgi:PKD repeat protein
VLYYFAEDEAGNVEDELNREFRIDTQRPVAILSGPTTSEVDKSVTWDGSSSRDSNGIVEYYFDYGDNRNSGWVTNPRTAHTYKKDGTFTVELKVKDKAGLVSAPQTKTINVKKKKGGGGGIFDPVNPDDPDDPNAPFYKKSMNVAGAELPCLWLLILGLIVLIAIIAAAVAASRRRKRAKQMQAVREDDAYEKGWRSRREDDPAYDDEPVAFGYRDEGVDDFDRPSRRDRGDRYPRRRSRPRPPPVEESPFVAMDEPVPERTAAPDLPPEWKPPPGQSTSRFKAMGATEADPIPMPEEPAPKPVEKPVEPAPAPAPAPAPRPEPKVEPRPEPKPEPAPKVEPRPEPAPRPEPKKAPESEPGPPKKETKPKKAEDIDIDAEIGDILNRLDL